MTDVQSLPHQEQGMIVGQYHHPSNENSDNTSNLESGINKSSSSNNDGYRDEDEKMYQSYFVDSQLAIKTMNDADVLKNKLRAELEKYLDASITKTDSEGNSLIHYPSNFNTISEAMNRDDLLSLDERPWTKYLLSGNFEKDISKDYGGRYTNVFASDKTDESRIDQGLAEIHLLDSQLMKISKEAASLKAQNNNTKKSKKGSSSSNSNSNSNSNNISSSSSNINSVSNTGTALGDGTATTPSSTPRSTISRMDSLFLTRGKVSRAPSERADTPSSIATSRIDFDDNHNNNNNSSMADYDDMLNIDLTRLLDDALLSNLNSTKKQKKNFLQQNIKQAQDTKSSSALTEEEEIRVYELLRDDCNIDAYGYTDSEAEKLKSIDLQLDTYGQTNRINDIYSNGIDNTEMDFLYVNTKANTSKMGTNTDECNRYYLAEQRAIRLRNNYMMKLDHLLDDVKNVENDLLSIAVTTTASSNDSSSPVSGNSTILTIPEVSQLQLGKSITMSDIKEALVDAKASQSSEIASSTGNAKLELDRLLSSIKGLVNRLSYLRKPTEVTDYHATDGTANGYSNNNQLQEEDDDENYDMSSAYNASNSVNSNRYLIPELSIMSNSRPSSTSSGSASSRFPDISNKHSSTSTATTAKKNSASSSKSSENTFFNQPLPTPPTTVMQNSETLTRPQHYSHALANYSDTATVV